MAGVDKQPFMKCVRASLIFQFSLLFLWGCDSPKYEIFQGSTQGTQYHITAKLPKNTTTLKIQEVIDKSLANVDISLSTYRDDSEISRFNKMPIDIPVNVSQEFIDVLDVSREVFKLSAGAFNPSVNDLVQLWGFGRKISVTQSQVVPDDKAIDQAKLTMNFEALKQAGREIQKMLPVKLDFNGVAQGYTVDVLGKALRAQGVENYMIEVGGEVATRGVSPRGNAWRIGVELPDDLMLQNDNKVFAALLLNDANLATSGDYRDYYEIEGKRYSHTLDPQSGRPITHNLASVTVVTKTTGHADAWATAFMVLGETAGFELAEKLNIPAYFIYRKNGKFDVKLTNAMQAYVEH
jgi:thiamine biosynthesis lipoprotein